jgi:NhaA family Na+:H+ antiporter
MRNMIAAFLRLEAAAGAVLALAALAAVIVANTSFGPGVGDFFATKLRVGVGPVALSKPLLLWINDGLMAIFFLLVGLELKREVVEGELSQPSQIVLPAAAALGGMVVPALFYAALNHADTQALRGWAIPAATDIAFSLGVLAALGPRVPLGLKLFLTTLAVVDDLGAIVVIAVFYSGELWWLSLALGALCIAVLAALNRTGQRRLAPYLLTGIALWVCVLKSGVHATLAGVALGLFIPLRGNGSAPDDQPLRRLEHTLHPWVAYAILPVFAFANAGVSFEGMSIGNLFAPIPFGIAGGLFLGKLLGVFGVAALLVLAGVARMPTGGTWLKLLGVSVCAGIGFTMSLFIGTLAFEDPAYAVPVRLGVFVGSLLSALVGFLLLRCAPEDRVLGVRETDAARIELIGRSKGLPIQVTGLMHTSRL